MCRLVPSYNHDSLKLLCYVCICVYCITFTTVFTAHGLHSIPNRSFLLPKHPHTTTTHYHTPPSYSVNRHILPHSERNVYTKTQGRIRVMKRLSCGEEDRTTHNENWIEHHKKQVRRYQQSQQVQGTRLIRVKRIFVSFDNDGTVTHRRYPFLSPSVTNHNFVTKLYSFPNNNSPIPPHVPPHLPSHLPARLPSDSHLVLPPVLPPDPPPHGHTSRGLLVDDISDADVNLLPPHSHTHFPSHASSQSPLIAHSYPPPIPASADTPHDTSSLLSHHIGSSPSLINRNFYDTTLHPLPDKSASISHAGESNLWRKISEGDAAKEGFMGVRGKSDGGERFRDDMLYTRRVLANDRFLSFVIYIWTCVTAMPLGSMLFSRYPLLGQWCERSLWPLLVLNRIPFVGLLVSVALASANTSTYTKFNIQQTYCLSMAQFWYGLFKPLLMYDKVMDDIAGSSLFIFTLIACVYGCISSIVGMLPDRIPFISRQTKHKMKII
eukprot:GHVQ01028452.1.p1 GENE.GHVQ01028452.1~~GHVQ01028452.1.p1  ORF type:complete len:493 (+),score=57.01 GHVQ01028452.1:402-1880(+)